MGKRVINSTDHILLDNVGKKMSNQQKPFCFFAKLLQQACQPNRLIISSEATPVSISKLCPYVIQVKQY